jgi:hypothetical protein
MEGAIMTGIRFSKEEQVLLLRNKNVTNVTDKSITFSDEFKVNSIQSYAKGKFPAEIFRDAGFNLNIIGNKNPRKCINRWKRIYLTIGEDGLMGEKRGRGGSRPITLEMSLEERLTAAEAKVSYLEMENEFLKKLDELERRDVKK